MPVGVTPGSDDADGGASSCGVATPVIAWSLRASRGSSISSSLFTGGHSVETRDDRRLLRQVDEGVRPVGGDDLAAADLSVRLLPHAPSDCRGARRSCRYWLTSGSTSRSERLARNLR